MSSPAPELSVASASSVLQIHTLNSTGQKRSHALESEHSTDRKHKKRKRETNLEPSSTATGISQSLAPPSSTAASAELVATGSPRKDKDKKRKRKRKKMSVVTSEIEDDRAKRKRDNSLVDVAPASATSSVAVGSSGRVESNNRGAEVAVNNPNKGKGKEKAQERARSSAPSTHALNSSMAHGQLQQPVDMQLIDNLKQQLETQSQLLKRHQTHLTSVQQSLTCQICLDLLYKPFALAPCGHVACYDCLVRWFTAPGPGENEADNQNANRGRANANGIHVHKRKTCPICRARVSERPVEVWGMKDLVNALVRSKLVEIPGASGASSSNDRQGSAARATDPWHRIFRPVRTAFGGHHPFNPLWQNWAEDDDPVFAPDRVDGPLEDVGMFDAEDHVYRCLDCMHEIWDGRCSGCRREYPGHPAVGDDDDEDEDEVIEIEGDDDSDDELFGHGISLGEMLDRIEGRNGPGVWSFGVETDTEDEEDFTDEDGEGGSMHGGGGIFTWHEDSDEGEEDEPLFAHIEEEEEVEEVEEVVGVEVEEYESSFIDDSDSEGR